MLCGNEWPPFVTTRTSVEFEYDPRCRQHFGRPHLCTKPSASGCCALASVGAGAEMRGNQNPPSNHTTPLLDALTMFHHVETYAIVGRVHCVAHLTKHQVSSADQKAVLEYARGLQAFQRFGTKGRGCNSNIGLHRNGISAELPGDADAGEVACVVFISRRPVPPALGRGTHAGAVREHCLTTSQRACLIIPVRLFCVWRFSLKREHPRPAPRLEIVPALPGGADDGRIADRQLGCHQRGHHPRGLSLVTSNSIPSRPKLRLRSRSRLRRPFNISCQ